MLIFSNTYKYTFYAILVDGFKIHKKIPNSNPLPRILL